MSEVDIIGLDAEIHKKFQDDLSNLPKFEEKLKELENRLKKETLAKKTKKQLLECKTLLSEFIDDVKNEKSKSFYILECYPIIEEYKKSLVKPKKISFMGRAKVEEKDEKVSAIILSYVEAVKRYINHIIKNYHSPKKKNVAITCIRCDGKNFEAEESDNICLDCGCQQRKECVITSYKDVDRTNVTSKYSYERSIHFRDRIAQYQGTQFTTIHNEVYTGLEECFKKYGLLIDSPIKEIKYSKITKEHIVLFLEELEYDKFREDVNLIHYKITGVKPDDISHLEKDLLKDFEILSALYDKKNKGSKTERKSITSYYVLYQLLCARKHPCNKADFKLLKTLDRQIDHDVKYESLFEELGWTFTPLF